MSSLIKTGFPPKFLPLVSQQILHENGKTSLWGNSSDKNITLMQYFFGQEPFCYWKRVLCVLGKRAWSHKPYFWAHNDVRHTKIVQQLVLPIVTNPNAVM